MSEFGGEPELFRIQAEMSHFELPVVSAAADLPIGLVNSLDALAETVRGDCEQEEENRGRHDPGLLPVRWRDLTRHPESAAKPDLTGDLTTIARVYRKLPFGRLVVVGRAGSGKTMLTLRFVQDFVKTRTGTDRVPVIFSLASWDPTAIGLRDWMVERLLRDHTGLDGRTGSGTTLAAALVKANRILPVLDGFDEIATGLHHAALRELSRTALPWLLTSRPDEYDQAGRTLATVPTVELADLTAADLTTYLSRDASWAPVLEEIGRHPTGQVAQALRTPLMASLACTVHSDIGGENPAVLLDTTRFPSANAVEEHLLGGFVRAVYRDGKRWDPDDVWRWLGHLARHLHRLGTNDLAWWELCGTMRRSTRILTVVVTMSLLTVLFDWIVYMPVYMAEQGFAAGLRMAVLEGLLVAPGVGVSFGLGYGLLVPFRGIVIAPSRVRLRLRGPRTGRSIRGALAVGLNGGLVLGLGYGSAGTVLHRLWGHLFGAIPEETAGVELIRVTLVNSVVWGLIFALAGGLVLSLAVVLESPLDISKALDPVSLLAANRTTSLRQAAVHVPVVALAITIGAPLIVAVLQPLFGPLIWYLLGGIAIGLVCGCIGALGYLITMTAWGQWLILSRVWLPLTGRLPWAMVAFLQEAYELGVLRQAGASYQFRHERLRKHLADH